MNSRHVWVEQPLRNLNNYNMRELLGWLGTGLAQNTFNYLNIA